MTMVGVRGMSMNQLAVPNATADARRVKAEAADREDIVSTMEKLREASGEDIRSQVNPYAPLRQAYAAQTAGHAAPAHAHALPPAGHALPPASPAPNPAALAILQADPAYAAYLAQNGMLPQAAGGPAAPPVPDILSADAPRYDIENDIRAAREAADLAAQVLNPNQGASAPQGYPPAHQGHAPAPPAPALHESAPAPHARMDPAPVPATPPDVLGEVAVMGIGIVMRDTGGTSAASILHDVVESSTGRVLHSDILLFETAAGLARCHAGFGSPENMEEIAMLDEECMSELKLLAMHRRRAELGESSDRRSRAQQGIDEENIKTRFRRKRQRVQSLAFV